VNFCEQVLARRQRQRQEGSYNDRFGNLEFIPPTSNIVERLWSTTKFTFNDLRKRLKPETLEMLICLRANRRLWDMDMLVRTMGTAAMIDEIVAFAEDYESEQSDEDVGAAADCIADLTELNIDEY
jgi:hypothetical protein